VIETIQSLLPHQLVIMRRLRSGPLTEFELAQTIVERTNFSAEQAAEYMSDWLEALRLEGLIWSGQLTNIDGQRLLAAALTRHGRELVG